MTIEDYSTLIEEAAKFLQYKEPHQLLALVGRLRQALIDLQRENAALQGSE